VVQEHGLSCTPGRALNRIGIDLGRSQEEGRLEPIQFAVLEVHKAHHLVLGPALSRKVIDRSLSLIRLSLKAWLSTLVFQKLQKVVLINSNEAYWMLLGSFSDMDLLLWRTLMGILIFVTAQILCFSTLSGVWSLERVLTELLLRVNRPV